MKQLMFNILFVIMAFFELFTIVIGWILAVIHAPTALRWVKFWERKLPDVEWYERN